MYYLLNETDLKIMEKVQKYIHFYVGEDNSIDIDNFIGIIENLLDEIESLKEKIEDIENDRDENYKPIPQSEMYE